MRLRVATPEDADADPEEGRHQQEVPEEPDVDDVGRDPADEQQLDEQDGRGRQEEAGLGAAKDRPEGPRNVRTRTSSGGA